MGEVAVADAESGARGEGSWSGQQLPWSASRSRRGGGAVSAPDGCARLGSIDGDPSPRVYAPTPERLGLACGFVGAGRAGSRWRRAHARGWPVRAVSSRDEGRRAAVAQALPVVSVMARAADVAAGRGPPAPDRPRRRHRRPSRRGCASRRARRRTPRGALRRSLRRPWRRGRRRGVPSARRVRRRGARGRCPRGRGRGSTATRSVAVLRQVAAALGAQPVVLAATVPRGKAAYHAAAVLAAGGFVASSTASPRCARWRAGRGRRSRSTGRSSVRASRTRRAGHRWGPHRAVPRATRAPSGRTSGARRLAPGALELYLAAARRELAIAGRRRARAPTADARRR